MNTWTYDIGNWYPEEGSPYIGNGWIGGSIPLNGHGGSGCPYGAAVAANYMGPSETFVMAPHWLNATVRFDGRAVKPAFRQFRKVLDLRQGTFTTAYTDTDGCVRVETETFCHRAHACLSLYRMAVTALKPGAVEVIAALDAAVCRGLSQSVFTAGDRSVTALLDFGDADRRIGQVLTVLAAQPATVPAPWRQEPTAAGLAVQLECASGARISLDIAVATTRGADPLPEARSALSRLPAGGYEDLRMTHAAAMAGLWQGFDVSAEDPFLERRLRGAMFFLTAGFREDVVWGGTPSSLSSKPNWGNCVFWDTEFYMFPALLLTHPELARNTLVYRHRMLPGARRNAAASGAAGARFGWQSHLSGSGHAGPFENEIHVTADIAYCAWWYGQSANDAVFMREFGRELIVEAARFFASATTWNTTTRRAEIHGVIPPDEHVWDHYAGVVNNSVMTNAYAAWVLAKGAELGDGFATPEERADWQRLASAMFLPRDEQRGMYLEYEGYPGHPIKQADVGHVFFPLQPTVDRAEIRRTVMYYADRERETGLYLLHSPFVYGAALSRAGDGRGVRRFLELSQRNATGPFEVPRESNYGGGVCTTASGSLLGLALYGLLGIENQGERLEAHPCLTDETGRLSVTGLTFGGRRYAVAAEPGSGEAVIRAV